MATTLTVLVTPPLTQLAMRTPAPPTLRRQPRPHAMGQLLIAMVTTPATMLTWNPMQAPILANNPTTPPPPDTTTTTTTHRT